MGDGGQVAEGASELAGASTLLTHALAAALPRGAARLQDELRSRGGVRAEEDALVEDQEAPVEQFAEVDAAAGVGAGAGAGRDLHPTVHEPHGIVAGHEAGVPTAEHAIEIAGGGPPGRRGVSRRAEEAGDEVGEELGQERVGRGNGVDATEAQFADEAILQRLPQPLDAAFGLGRLRRDEADPEVGQDDPEVGGILLAAQLLLETPLRIVALEDAVAIPIQVTGSPYCRQVCPSTVK